MRNEKKTTTAKTLGLLLALIWVASPAWAITTIEVGSTYSDLGAQAADNYDGDISTRIVTASTVNTTVLGSYAVTYSVADSSGNAAMPAVRTVKVVDTQKPVITLVGGATVSAQLGSPFVDPGATAKDNYDGDISSKIVKSGNVNTSVPGSYMVTYNVSDSSGNAALPVVRTVTVSADTTKPVIRLIGNSTITIKVGRAYVDAGATALDNVDGNITSKIVTTNTVKTSAPGVCAVTYNVTDAAGNVATPVVRTVRVTFWAKTEEDANALFIASPLSGSTYYASAGMGKVTLTLTASAPVDAESVEYALDGTVVGSSTEAPYTVAAEVDPAGIGWGEHHVTAAAKLSTSEETVTDESTFTLAAVSGEADVNNNGLADNPFATLSLDGDVWSHTVVVPDTNGKRVTGMARFDGLDETDNADTPVVLVLGGASDAVASVTIPRNLLTVDETGIVIVQLAQDLDTLVGSDEAGLLLPEPDGLAFVKGGAYLEVSVLTSTDDGVTFEEVDEVRLADHPVRVEMQGLEPSPGSTVSLYKHPMFVDSDSTTGVAVISHEGSWSTSGVHDVSVEGDWMNASLTSLSVMAPYEPIDTNTPQLPAGCVGGSLNTTLPGAAGGDILIMSFALLTLFSRRTIAALVVGGSKAVVRRARATQRP